jgi:tRNA (guanine-N7-)-methyltransferase
MAKKQLKEFPDIALRQEDIDGIISFSDIFGRKGPVHIEIGSGKGTFLVNQAKEQLETNFLGIEWSNKYCKFTVDRIGRWALESVRVICADAAVFIAEHIGNESVDCFHIYFPDPWPKKRHHKRRFICASSLEQMSRCLKKDGLINIATDHAEYFQWMMKVFDEFKDRFTAVEFIKPAGANENENAGTNFERKYLKENRSIYTAAFRKK